MAAGLDGDLLFPGTAGFPSLLVTYGVANDYFFSWYMAIAVFAATELGRLARPQLTLLVVVVALFGVATVLVLRAHYTMDVFAGTMARRGLVKSDTAPELAFSETCSQRTTLAGGPVVQARLGHADPCMTLAVYAYVLPGSQQQAVDQPETGLRPGRLR